ncbi:glutathione peroxidase [Paenibacillus sp. UNCCL117]|uniref:glutathione peroxidase n=1 Tax=unclassified Paenibacillus TaxID=185978 RepID=UPI00088A6F8A|nr:MULTISPECIES: glutathione peroxidase [unclassified Paenibacillus]SDC50796.1 glutathione peroxidase [Paenibacillus sp. cl123]SFW11559.1 glutathione peroxidase [Paenibacillus sp. UNCCL117]
MNVYEFTARTIDGHEQPLSAYAGKVLLIVNTASACGLTPHYKGLQELHESYAHRGLVVLGFPCNQFAGQEPGTEEDIKQFCELNYNISFPLFAKIDVKGANAHPLYKYLVDNVPEPYRTGDIEWNFVKFLVNREGDVVKQFGARTEPSELKADIEELLG